MKSCRYSLAAFFSILALTGLLAGQQTTQPSVVVPRLVNYSGRATDAKGNIISGIAGITFSIYSEQEGGAPLWMETQNVTADSKGNYTVQLGASQSQGLPLDLFSSGEARWLGVRINGGEEQPRVLLLSVPYALKAADAQTLGGLPASAFVMAASTKSAASTTSATAPPAPAVTGSGTVNRVAKFVGSSQIGNSDIFDGGGKVGVGTSTPTAKFDVAGTARVRSATELDGAVTANSAVIANAGVTGLSISSSTAGLTGQDALGGYGLYGIATGTSGQGVWGESLGTEFAANGQGADGVHGQAHSSAGSGVAGLNSDPAGIGVYGQGFGYGVQGVAARKGLFFPATGIGVYGSSGTGIGVYGTAPSGFGFATDSNVQQARTAGGWVKAMVYVNAYNPPYQIVNCFNSTLSGAAATTPPCGINFTEVSDGLYHWDLDFGFEVDDRFISATLASWNPAAGQVTIGAAPVGTTTVGVSVLKNSSNGAEYETGYFYVFVY